MGFFFQSVTSMLSAGDRRALAGVLALSLLTALIEVVGVGGIYWFFNLIIEPQAAERHQALAWLKETLALESHLSFLTVTGLLVLGIFMLRILLSIALVWAQDAFGQSRHHLFTERLLTRYLGKPYEEFIALNTATLNKNLVSEVPRVVNGIVLPAVRLVSYGVISAAIAIALIAYNPLTSFVVIAIIGGVYAALYMVTQGPERRLGELRSAMDESRFRIATEALTGFKEIKVFASEGEYLSRFSVISRRFVRYELIHKLLSQIPHHVLEGVAFAVLMTIVLVSLRHAVDPAEVVAEVSLYAFAAYRLMPSVRNFASSLAELRFHESALKLIGAELTPLPESPGPVAAAPEMPLAFGDVISLRNVGFTFPGRKAPAVDDITLEIRKNAAVGLVGATGAGKSTLVDLLLGLIEPQQGEILVDGVQLTEHNRAAWRAGAGYVPQQIFLADDTVWRNIAFGRPDDAIDMERVRRAAELARISDFIESELPEGYETLVGDRGLRLSGGQRQRIGIARALYRDPVLLVLDEATSALDAETEAAVSESISALAGEITVVAIAHRLSTVKGCGVIHLLDHGKLQASGTFDELCRSSEEFRRMIGLSRTESAAE